MEDVDILEVHVGCVELLDVDISVKGVSLGGVCWVLGAMCGTSGGVWFVV
jgi:hypothetical protein